MHSFFVLNDKRVKLFLQKTTLKEIIGFEVVAIISKFHWQSIGMEDQYSVTYLLTYLIGQQQPD